ncbi:SDR family oxidoreductase [Halomarina ordinaria]|uniref:SDR family oxidoreductase n=1 Tax=Halomarina ordinaria TaxID=3033939 RepID=A0ABD5UCK3_9EURY|nr:SDR family oxidoreductase [Halomarina sp. PSRA2]
MDFGLDGDSALVTAGSSGLGLASAKALAREGAHVAVCGTTPDHLAAAEAELADLGEGDVLAMEADITDREQVEGFVDATVAAFGGLDHVVTSAGGPPSGSFLDTDDEDWYAAYDLLVMSAVWTTRFAHPHLADGGGTIVNITSVSVKEVIDGLVLSNAVRRAVVGLMKTQSREFAPEVRVNAVLPGSHETARISDLVEQGVERGEYDSYEAGLAEWGSGVPLGRIGDAHELGEAVAYLSSDRSSYVNGVSLPVDGGSMRS